MLDFYCPAHRLAVEIGGAAHDHPERAARDVVRDRWLKEQGVHVLRVPAIDVLSCERRLDVLATIAACAEGASSTAFHAVPLLRDAEEEG